MAENTETNNGGEQLVTAVITTYNRPKLARSAIESAVAQTYEPLEIIIVEDGTDSGIEEWLKENYPEEVRYLSHEKNKGLSAARNTGWRNAEGQYVAYLDDDDEWEPSKIEKQVELAISKGEEFGIFYCGHKKLDQNGEIVNINQPKLRGNIREEIIHKGLSTNSSTFMFRKKALKTIGGFDEELNSHIDYDIWMQVARAGYYCDLVDEPLALSVDHDIPTMMSDVDTRVPATKKYIEKWRPVFEEWVGTKEAEKRMSAFYTKIISNNGVNDIPRLP